MPEVIVGFGANLGDPERSISAAVEALARSAEVVAASRLWRTRPIGPDQPDYTNAAALLRSSGSPQRLLDLCLELEVEAGRDRSNEERWGPRVLDLDLLVACDLVWRSPALELPHPRLHLRAFALVPAAEVAPDWVHPLVGRSLADLAAAARAADPDALLSSQPLAPLRPRSR